MQRSVPNLALCILSLCVSTLGVARLHAQTRDDAAAAIAVADGSPSHKACSIDSASVECETRGARITDTDGAAGMGRVASNEGAARLVNAVVGSTRACAQLPDDEVCVDAYAASAIARADSMSVDRRIVVSDSAGSHVIDATLTIVADSTTTLLASGAPPAQAPLVIVLRAPIATSLPDSVSMLRIVHAASDRDVGRLDVVARLSNAARIQRDRLAYTQRTDFVAVVPGPFNLYGYFSDFASREMPLDEAGVIPPGAYVTILITGTLDDQSLGAHLLIDSDTSAGPLERLEDRSTLAAPVDRLTGSVSASPNPTSGRTRLALGRKTDGNADVVVIDALGRVIDRRNVEVVSNDRACVVELGEYPAGVYGVMVSDRHGVVGWYRIVRRQGG